MHRPAATEYAPYFEKYVKLVPENDIVAVLRSQVAEVLGFLREVPPAQENVRHAPYTWSIKEVIGHLIDTERIFGYRALRFARGDTTPLPGFDENAYVPAAHFDRRSLKDLAQEFEHLRLSHVALFGSLDEEASVRKGEASGNTMSVRAVGYAIAGHTRHHLAILRQRLARV